MCYVTDCKYDMERNSVFSQVSMSCYPVKFALRCLHLQLYIEFSQIFKIESFPYELMKSKSTYYYLKGTYYYSKL